MTTDLLVDLYAQDHHSTTGPQIERDRLFYRAAREIERLTRERDEAERRAGDHAEEIVRLAAKCDRLRAALELVESEIHRPISTANMAQEMWHHAKKALGEPKPYKKAREALIAYLLAKVREQDWHGVMDATADLRVLEAAQGVKGST